MIEIMIDLQGGAKAPLYEKIYEYIKRDVIEGKIPVGEKLPSTRLLAKHMNSSLQRDTSKQNLAGVFLCVILQSCMSLGI